MKKAMDKASGKRAGPGNPSPYNSDIHDLSIQEILSRGDFVKEFCAVYDINESTYHQWRKVHPTFKAMGDKGRRFGEMVWLKKPLQAQERAFTHQYWATIMRVCYNFDKAPKVELSGTETPDELLNLALKLYASGKIAERQFDRIVKTAESKIKFREWQEFEKRLDELEAKLNKRK